MFAVPQGTAELRLGITGLEESTMENETRKRKEKEEAIEERAIICKRATVHYVGSHVDTS